MRVAKLIAGEALQKQIATGSSDQEAGEHGKKGINSLGQNISLGIESCSSEQIDSHRMEDGHHQSQKQSLASTASRANPVSGHNRFAVARFQGMKGAESAGHGSSKQSGR